MNIKMNIFSIYIGDYELRMNDYNFAIFNDGMYIAKIEPELIYDSINQIRFIDLSYEMHHQSNEFFSNTHTYCDDRLINND